MCSCCSRATQAICTCTPSIYCRLGASAEWRRRRLKMGATLESATRQAAAKYNTTQQQPSPLYTLSISTQSGRVTSPSQAIASRSIISPWACRYVSRETFLSLARNLRDMPKNSTHYCPDREREYAQADHPRSRFGVIQKKRRRPETLSRTTPPLRRAPPSADGPRSMAAEATDRICRAMRPFHVSSESPRRR